MTRFYPRFGTIITVVSLSTAYAAASLPVPLQIAPPTASTPQSASPPQEREVRGTIVPGQPSIARPAEGGVVSTAADVTVNFPGVEVGIVARAVLGDILGRPYVVASGVSQTITLVTGQAVPREALLPLFEQALQASGLALIDVSGVLTVTTIEQARSNPAVAGASGFGSETVTLEFVNADEMKRLLDPVLPGVVTATDAARNTLSITGSTGQRANVRELLSQFDVNWLRNMSFALLIPQRTDSRLIVPELDRLINAPDAPTRGLVRLIAMERLNGVLAISSQRQYLDDVRRWVEILDREGESAQRRLFVYRVQNGRSRDLARVLNTAFGGSAGETGDRPNSFGFDPAPAEAEQVARHSSDYSNARAPRVEGAPAGQVGDAVVEAGASDAIRANISSDETNNAIVVFGTPREYAVIADALRQLDVLPAQVMIEAAIAEVTLTNDLRYGVQFLFDDVSRSDFRGGVTEGTSGAPTQIFPGLSALLANADITATLNALENVTTVNVVSSPKLMVLNNQTASFQVGEQVPVSTQSAVGVQNPDSPIVNSIEYRDTGIILRITPRVNSSGIVLLDIAQEVSSVVEGIGGSGPDSPTISTRRIATSVAVQDGRTLAIGGLIERLTQRDSRGVPFLSRIPVVGALLGTQGRETSRTELLILLKPRVVRTVDDGTALTDELRAKLSQVTPILDRERLP